MADAEETVWVIFNGEIYNFPELRSELESSGHVFRTRSDTEVIIHGYKQWGTEVLNRLNGMFGLAIWDDRRKRLVIARDAAGIKLVYYHVDNGTVSFGSELRAVLAGLSQRPEIDVTAVNLFLRYRYTPSPLTLHQGVRKLAPGTMAVFENGDWRVERWYRFRPDPVFAGVDRRRCLRAAAGHLQARTEAASDQRRSRWPFAERRRRLRTAARLDAPLRRRMAHVHRRIRQGRLQGRRADRRSGDRRALFVPQHAR